MFCSDSTRHCIIHLGFLQTHKIGNNGIIASSVFPYICSSILYLHHMMLVNMKLDISDCKRIIFQGCRLHWSSSFLMVQLKQSWLLVLWKVYEKPLYRTTKLAHIPWKWLLCNTWVSAQGGGGVCPGGVCPGMVSSNGVQILCQMCRKK